MTNKPSKTVEEQKGERVSFKRILPPQRIVEIGEYEFDVSRIPAKVSIRIADMLLLFGTLTNDHLVDLAVEILQLTRPELKEITKEWLLSPEVSDATTILDIAQYVTKPAVDQFKKKEDDAGDSDPNGKASQK